DVWVGGPGAHEELSPKPDPPARRRRKERVEQAVAGGVVALLEGNLHGPVLRHGDPRVELIGAGEIAVHDDRLAPRDVPSQEFLGHLPAAALGSFRLAAAPGTWAHVASPERLSSTR